MSIRDLIERDFQELGFEGGTGLLSAEKAEITDNDRFMIIGTGGNGIGMVQALKKELYHQIKPSEVQKKVKFFCIDTDQNAFATNSNLSGEERIILQSTHNVYESINPDGDNYAAVKDWVNPMLYATVNENESFAGIGASQNRQVGRSHMVFNANYSEITEKIAQSAEALVGQGCKNLVVLFFTGIAGGTGSGTIVDTAIIVRKAIEDLKDAGPLAVVDKVEFDGYVILPPACKSDKKADATSVQNGNRNAYAALKEIDYFYSMADNQDTFVQQYGNIERIVDSPLFDHCTLIDGGTNNLNLTARDIRNAIVQCVINTMKKTDMKDPNHPQDPLFLTESLLSNKEGTLRALVRSKSAEEFPRNANYKYSIIGYTEIVFPRDLLNAYLLKKVFDEMKKLWDEAIAFKRQEKPDKDVQVAEFLKANNADFKAIKANADVVAEELMKGLEALMIEVGPAYVVEFTNAMMEYFNDERLKQEAKSGSIIGGKQAAQMADDLAYLINDIVLPINNQAFEVLVPVYEELSAILTKDAGILTESTEYKRVFGNTFMWTPVNLQAVDGKESEFLGYVDGMIREEEIQGQIREFFKSLWDNRDQWAVYMDPQNRNKAAGAELVRKYITENIDQLVGRNSLDLLVKAYLDNPDATAVDPDGEATPELTQVAAEIYKRFEKQSSPFAQYIDPTLYANIATNKYIAVPSDWSALRKALEAYQKQNAVRVPFSIYTDEGTMDKISAYQANVGVAPYMLNWTKLGQQCYEQNVNTIGLHMAQAKTGKNWTIQPNLIPEVLRGTQPQYRSGREQGIEASVDVTFAYLADLNLIAFDEDPQLQDTPYYVYLPNEKKSAADFFAKLQEIGVIRDPKLQKKPLSLAEIFADAKTLDAFVQDKFFSIKKIQYPMMYCGKNGVGPDADAEKQEVYESMIWMTAEQIVRRRVEYLMLPMQKSEVKMKELEALVADHNAKIAEGNAMKNQVKVFADLLLLGYLIFEPDKKQWKIKIPKHVEYTDDNFYVGGAGRLKLQCGEYFAFEAFKRMDPRKLTFEDCDDADLLNNTNISELTAKQKETKRQQEMMAEEMKEGLLEYLYELRDAEEPTPNVKFPLNTAEFEHEVIERFQDEELVFKIREFYNKLIKEIEDIA